MSLTQCRFCEQANPRDSRFCNACGGQLNLAPCPRCGAVNDITATSCYQCSGGLAQSRTDAPDLTLLAVHPIQLLGRRGVTEQDTRLGEGLVAVTKPVALAGSEVANRGRGRRSRAIVGTLVLAAIGLFGYYALRPHAPVDVPPPPVANNGAEGPVRPIVRQTPIQDTRPAKPASSAISGAGGAAAVTRFQPTNAAAPCTEAIAALGLCTLRPVRNTQTEAVSTAPAAIARPQANSDVTSCTEAATVLGLCAPKPTGRTE